MNPITQLQVNPDIPVETPCVPTQTQIDTLTTQITQLQENIVILQRAIGPSHFPQAFTPLEIENIRKMQRKGLLTDNPIEIVRLPRKSSNGT